MFICYLHSWTSRDDQCPICNPLQVWSSSDTSSKKPHPFEAAETLSDAINSDNEYRESWKATIAMAIHDYNNKIDKALEPNEINELSDKILSALFWKDNS
jgi:hypothetical protein